MSAVAALAESAVTAREPGAVAAERVVEAARDVYSLWKSIFERARPSEGRASSEGTPAVIVHSSRPQFAIAGADQQQTLSPWADSGVDSVRVPRRLVPATEIQSQGRAGEAGAAMAVRSGGATGIVDPAPLPFISRQPLRPHDIETAQAELHGGSASDPSYRERAATPLTRDSVNVFVNGLAVTVIVRDAEIPASAALQCAFETARELTGRRAALQRLTLNGRMLYQSRSVEGSLPSKLPALLFEC